MSAARWSAGSTGHQLGLAAQHVVHQALHHVVPGGGHVTGQTIAVDGGAWTTR